MKRRIPLIIVFLIAAALFYLSWGSYTEDKLIKSEIQKLLDDAYSPVVRIFDYSMLEGLPEPVEKYFRNVLPEGTSFIQSVRLEQDGYLMTKPNGDWKHMTAYQYFSTTEPGFIWRGAMKILPFVTISARDKYYQGKGEMRIRFADNFNIALAAGTEMDISALIRYFSEGIWFPTSLLPSRKLRWEAVDSATAKAYYTDNNMTVSGVFYFNDAGEIVKMTSDERYMFKDGMNVREKWSVYMGNYKEFSGVKVPTSAEAEWNLVDGDYKYFKAEITDVKYDVHKN